jgi:hypothetical protein
MPGFSAQGQSKRKVMLSFQSVMQVNAALTNPANYTVTKVDGTAVGITSINVVGTQNQHVELILGADLLSSNHYSVYINTVPQTVLSQSISPDKALFQWIERLSPINIDIAQFSGEVTSGLLGTPAGQVFFSPALTEDAANSVIQIEDIRLCTRAFDVYTIPNTSGAPTFYTWPTPSTIPSLLNGDDRLVPASARLGWARAVLTPTMPPGPPVYIDLQP